MSHPDDEFEFGKDVCYDGLLDDYPELADDARFHDLLDELFDEPLNWEEAHDAFEELEDYLDEHYDIDLDDYFQWDDWRAEHADS